MFLNTVIVVSKLIRSVQITVLTVLTLEVFRLLINKHIDLLDRNNIHLSNVITRKSLICVNSSFPFISMAVAWLAQDLLDLPFILTRRTFLGTLHLHYVSYRFSVILLEFTSTLKWCSMKKDPF